MGQSESSNKYEERQGNHRHPPARPARQTQNQQIQLQVVPKKVAAPPPQKKGPPPKIKNSGDLALGEKNLLQMLAEMETKGRTFDKMEILEGTSHNFESLFSRFMGGDLKAIRIVEPYLLNQTQFHILFHFIECCVYNSPNLQLIQVITKTGVNAQQQQSNLNDISKSLSPRGIKFIYELETTEHDRSIV